MTAVELLTEPAVTLQLPVLAPAAMVRSQLAVGSAVGSVLLRVMAAPPAGAGPLSVTCTVAAVPIVTEAGATVTEETMVPPTGTTVTCAVWLLPE